MVARRSSTQIAVPAADGTRESQKSYTAGPLHLLFLAFFTLLLIGIYQTITAKYPVNGE